MTDQGKDNLRPLLPGRYPLGLFFTLVFPLVILAAFFLVFFRSSLLAGAETCLQESVEQLKDLARQRYDLIRMHQFQEENYIELRLTEMADLIADTCRQAELSVARKHVTENAVQALMLSTIKSLKPGETGYTFILSPEGTVLYHPSLPVEFDVSRYQFIREMLSQRDGFIRYWWQNPGEDQARERFVAYRYIHSWGWLIGVGIPVMEIRDTTFEQQQLEGFYEYIRSIRFKWHGIAAIYSREGKVVAHPTAAGRRTENIPGGREILNCGTGICGYRDVLGRPCRAAVSEFEPFGWILAVTARDEEILRPVHQFRNWLIPIGTLGLMLCYIILFRISRTMAVRMVRTARKKSNAIPGATNGPDSPPDSGER